MLLCNLFPQPIHYFKVSSSASDGGLLSNLCVQVGVRLGFFVKLNFVREQYLARNNSGERCHACVLASL